MSNITVSKVAQLAGVHRTTASRALNNDPKLILPDQTRRRIYKAAERLGFKKNDRVMLPTGAKSFGLLMTFKVDEHRSPLFMRFFNGLNQEAAKSRLNIFLIHNTKKLNLVSVLRHDDFIGIVQLGHVSSEARLACEICNKPHICLEPSFIEDSAMMYQIRTDFYEETYKATQYLIAHGHRRIYFLDFKSSGRDHPACVERYNGVAMAMKEAGIEIDDNRISVELSSCDDESQPIEVVCGYRAMQDLIKRNPPRPFACVCYADIYAEGAYQAAKEYGLRIPEDVSFVGYDNAGHSAQMSPALTTVNVPAEKMSQKIIETLLVIEKGQKVDHDIIFPAGLIERESVLSLQAV